MKQTWIPAISVVLFNGWLLLSCNKDSSSSAPPLPPRPVDFITSSWYVNNSFLQTTNSNVSLNPVIRFNFGAAINRNSASGSISFTENNGTVVPFSLSYTNGDSTVLLSPAASLKHLTKYRISVANSLKSSNGGSLKEKTEISLLTPIDSTDKFPVISDTALVQLVQQQTFKYFWDFAHPVSGLARERNTSGETVTSGGSGFGVMAILVGIHRGFISRAEGLTRLQKITDFLKNKAQRFHGAFPHWLNGTTGIVVPFSAKDNGADLVETSFLFQGLLCARQYFALTNPEETTLRNDINSLWNAVEWDWFRRANEDVLYWHWSPNYAWDMNMPVKGWNEALITYVLAASSPTHAIPKSVYDNGWASNGTMRNNSTSYGYQLPLGPNLGGPLFFEHYSFLGINPFGLSDQYANYEIQAVNHAKINYEYSKENPRNYYGYSDQSWGLTASDIPGGYSASSPTNDLGVIAPTAALSSFPYTPTESMKAMRFFYYKLGDRLWGEFGFKDAFSLHEPWFADSYLAIDQGPIIVMIENYRSGLLWSLFMSCPEVKAGMSKLGFKSPHL
jgi:hypothetical protein